MGKSPNWIIVSQTPYDLARYLGPIVWVSKCLRCGQEEPTYEGYVPVAVFQGKEFIRLHKNCKPKEDSRSYDYRTSHLQGKFPGKNMGD